MTYPNIIDVVFKVVETFERLGISYYIGGSLASSAFGISRATLDADIVADIELEHVLLIIEPLKEKFYIDAEKVKEAVHQRSSFNIIHLESAFKLDIFIPKDRPFDEQVFSRIVQKTVSEDTSQQLFFASPEDIILSKLEWYKSGGEVSDRQWNDILGILKVQGTVLDIVYLKHWAKELNIFDLLKKVLDKAKIF